MRKAKALCPDAKIRVVYYGEPDTFFSRPAHTYIKVEGRSKRISGFVCLANKNELPASLIPNSGLEFTAFSKFIGILPNHVLTVKAMYMKKDLYNLHRWRWVWDSLKYSEKWGTAW